MNFVALLLAPVVGRPREPAEAPCTPGPLARRSAGTGRFARGLRAPATWPEGRDRPGRAKRNPIDRLQRLVFRTGLLWALLLLTACSTPRTHQPANSRPFNFATDTFAYANELVWEYYYDEDGKWHHRENPTDPDYTQHCFVVARSTRQFFQHARFDAAAAPLDERTYRQRVRDIISRDPAEQSPEKQRVVIPGYANLRSFSAAHESLLKEACGGAWESYLQRGNWRMIFPFSRHGQEKEAEALVTAIRSNRPPIVHVLTFPKIEINHALLLFDVCDQVDNIRFTAYDPNQPGAPVTLTFDRTQQQFTFPSNDYWKGGKLSVYEIYRAWNY